MKNLKNTVLEEILPRVRKPGQYVGSERNAVVKDHHSVELKVALAYPDTYTVGMSHLGLKILYHMLNGRDDVAAERVFAPWIDMEEELRRRELPLYSLETFTPLGEFDVVGFSIQYELCHTNVLNMLELGGIPLLSEARSGADPVILAGGSLSTAMEPLVPFMDAILVGDAEDVLHTVIDTLIEWKRGVGGRGELYSALAVIPGIYVPSLYGIEYNEDKTIQGIVNLPPAPSRVKKLTVRDLDSAPFPTKPVVPNIEVVHDRINIEIMRGCPNHCRFCQALERYKPLKLRSPERVVELCEESFRNTGYEEINLSSLSTADYPKIEKLVSMLGERFSGRRVNVSLPSLRVGEELGLLPALTSSVRKSGLTFAPEVATDRLRKIVRKPITNENLMRGCEAAYRAGYRLLKLYFMIGVPGERDEDVTAILDLVGDASKLRRRITGRPAALNVAISYHVPKPHTAFQWEAMGTREALSSKRELVFSRRIPRSIRVRFHDIEASYLEAVFSRGDRRLAAALLKAREMGIRMDAWSECLSSMAWREAFDAAGIDPDFYALRKRSSDEILPWEMIETHTPKEYLLREKERFEEAVADP